MTKADERRMATARKLATKLSAKGWVLPQHTPEVTTLLADELGEIERFEKRYARAVKSGRA